MRALAGLALLAAAGVAWPQVPAPPSAPLPPETLPSDKPLPPPQFRKPPAEVLELPPLPPAETGRVPFLPRVVVRQFRITGNTAISDAELAKVAAPF